MVRQTWVEELLVKETWVEKNLLKLLLRVTASYMGKEDKKSMVQKVNLLKKFKAC